MKEWLWFALVGTLLAQGCSTDECASGESRCLGTGLQTCVTAADCGDISCKMVWGPAGCNAGQTCIQPGTSPPMCVESTSKDPQCNDSSLDYCIGNNIAYCSSGYRTDTGTCDGGYYRCVESASDGATCMAPGMALEPACAGGTGPVCKGNVLVECDRGYAVATTACGRCSVTSMQTCSNCTAQPVRNCSGYLGLGCAANSDCASGLVCRMGVCTASCSLDSSVATADAGTSAASTIQNTCFSALTADGPTVASYYVLPTIANRTFACIAGYCEWQY